MFVFAFFFSSRRRHTRCALVTGVQTCALPIYRPRAAARSAALWQRETPLLALRSGTSLCKLGLELGRQLASIARLKLRVGFARLIRARRREGHQRLAEPEQAFRGAFALRPGLVVLEERARSLNRLPVGIIGAAEPKDRK